MSARDPYRSSGGGGGGSDDDDDSESSRRRSRRDGPDDRGVPTRNVRDEPDEPDEPEQDRDTDDEPASTDRAPPDVDVQPGSDTGADDTDDTSNGSTDRAPPDVDVQPGSDTGADDTDDTDDEPEPADPAPPDADVQPGSDAGADDTDDRPAGDQGDEPSDDDDGDPEPTEPPRELPSRPGPPDDEIRDPGEPPLDDSAGGPPDGTADQGTDRTTAAVVAAGAYSGLTEAAEGGEGRLGEQARAYEQDVLAETPGLDDPEDVAIFRRDDQFVAEVTRVGAAKLAQQDVAAQYGVDPGDLAADIEGADIRVTPTTGEAERAVQLGQAEQFLAEQYGDAESTRIVGVTDEGYRAEVETPGGTETAFIPFSEAAASEIGAMRVEEQLEAEYGRDLERGEDFTVEETDEGFRADLTGAFEQEITEERAERQIEEQYAEALGVDPEDIALTGFELTDEGEVEFGTVIGATEEGIEAVAGGRLEDPPERPTRGDVVPGVVEVEDIIEQSLEAETGVDLERGEDFRIVQRGATDEQMLESGPERPGGTGGAAPTERLTASLTASGAERVFEAQLEEETGAGLVAGEDFEVVETDDGGFAPELTEQGRARVRGEGEEEFGDIPIRIPETVRSMTSGQERDVAGGGERVETILAGASEVVDEAVDVTTEVVGVGGTSSIVAGRVSQEPRDRPVLSGAGAIANVPETALGLKELGEFGVETGRQTVTGGLGVDVETQFIGATPVVTGVQVDDEGFASRSAEAAAAQARGAVEYAQENPAETAGLVGGSLVGSGVAISGAARVSSRFGTATRYAIQPGEELLGTAGFRATRGVAGESAAQRLFPGREPLFLSEEAVIRGARAAGQRVRSRVSRERELIDVDVRYRRMGAGFVPPEIEFSRRSRAEAEGEEATVELERGEEVDAESAEEFAQQAQVGGETEQADTGTPLGELTPEEFARQAQVGPRATAARSPAESGARGLEDLPPQEAFPSTQAYLSEVRRLVDRQRTEFELEGETEADRILRQLEAQLEQSTVAGAEARGPGGEAETTAGGDTAVEQEAVAEPEARYPAEGTEATADARTARETAEVRVQPAIPQQSESVASLVARTDDTAVVAQPPQQGQAVDAGVGEIADTTAATSAEVGQQPQFAFDQELEAEFEQELGSEVVQETATELQQELEAEQELAIELEQELETELELEFEAEQELEAERDRPDPDDEFDPRRRFGFVESAVITETGILSAQEAAEATQDIEQIGESIDDRVAEANQRFEENR